MCTVTLLPIEQTNCMGVRIGCNRDESLLRPAALTPRERSFGRRSAILPIDPESNGTWIAVNDAGLAMVVLNRNRKGATATNKVAKRSRGTIIPSLLHCETIDEATGAAESLDINDFAPFRLLMISQDKFVEIDSSLPTRSCSPRRLDQAWIFTSSGLGDEVVEGPRTKLFRRVFSERSPVRFTAAQQDLFHLHLWPGREHLSVRMTRQDARTVSYTVVHIFGEAASMIYRPYDQHQFSQTERLICMTKTS